jgi:hypothetical protein
VSGSAAADITGSLETNTAHPGSLKTNTTARLLHSVPL